MQDFIKSAASQLGIDESTANNATGTVLGFLKDGMGDQFASIAEKLPGADQLIQGAAKSSDAEDAGGGGGLLDSVTKAASSMLGGGAGEGLDLMNQLQKTGLTADQGGSLITMLINFIKEKVGDEFIDQIAEKFPIVKSFVS